MFELFINMNLDNIRKILTQTDESIEELPSVEVEISDEARIRAFFKSVEFYNLLDDIYSRQAPKTYIKVRDKAKQIYFHRVIATLYEINVGNNLDLLEEIIKDHGKAEVNFVFDYLFKYFIELEWYEQCQDLKNFKEIVSSLY